METAAIKDSRRFLSSLFAAIFFLAVDAVSAADFDRPMKRRPGRWRISIKGCDEIWALPLAFRFPAGAGGINLLRGHHNRSAKGFYLYARAEIPFGG